jgi:hypothetical protein
MFIFSSFLLAIRIKYIIYANVKIRFTTLFFSAQKNQAGLKLNGTHQLLAYADDVNLLRDNIT